MKANRPLPTRRQILAALALAPASLAAACSNSPAQAQADGSTSDSSPDAGVPCAPVGQGAQITHGPLSGGSTSYSLRLALRLSAPGQVTFSLQPKAGGPPLLSSCGMAEQVNDFMVICQVTALQPATVYIATPLVDGQPVADRSIETRTFAQAGVNTAFSFVFGSCCRYYDDGTPSPSLGGTLDAAAALPERPWFFAQIGDWTYPDYLFSKTGLDAQGHNFSYYPEKIAASWRLKFSDKYPIRKLLATMPVAYVWDDHDFAENNAHKDVSGLQSDRVGAFARSMPAWPLPASKQGVWQKFSLGQCEFFLTDLRSQRTDIKQAMLQTVQPDGTKKWQLKEPPGYSLTGSEQMQWLLDGLTNSTATWKFVFLPVEINPRYDALLNKSIDMGIVLLIEALGDMWCGYQSDRAKLLALHTSGKVKNIIFLTGDAHMAAMKGADADCPAIFMAANLDISQAPIINMAEQFGFSRTDLWPEWCQDSGDENTIGRVRVVTEPKPQVIFESWGASGKLLHSMTVDEVVG